MKNKKGFTLVELLAVIAILAVLVIIALPNVVSMFNNAKKNAFATELKEIYRAAEQKWMSDSVNATANVYYARVDGTDDGTCSSCQQLKLSGRTELKYMISFTNGGKVKSLYATDGTYQYAYTGSGLNIEDIALEDIYQVAGLPESTTDDPTIDNTVLTITCNEDNYVDTSIGVVGGPARLVATYYDGETKLGTVSYYENGVTQSFKTDSDYSLTKSGHQFQGWGLTTSTKTFDGGATVTPEIIKQYEGNKKLYAVWKDVVTPSCILTASSSTINMSKTNAVQFGLVNGSSNTPTYNGSTSISLSGTGTYTGYVKGSTGIQKGCRAVVSSVSYTCPGGYSLSGNTCRANATPWYYRQQLKCTQNGSSSYSWISQSSGYASSCSGVSSPPSCGPSNPGQLVTVCRQEGYRCPDGSSQGSICSRPASKYCSNGGNISGNYCVINTTFSN